MILCDHFVFVHVPKTGGNFVRAVLEGYAPPSWNVTRMEDHATVFDMPASHTHLPRMTFVRNPYSWYVSWFHYQQRNREPFFLEISDGGRLPFQPAMMRAFDSRTTLQKGAGPFTQQLFHLLGESPLGVLTGRMETMRDDLLRFLRQLTEVPADMAAAIGALEKQNTSDHAHYRHYYDDELRALIRQKDAVVFDTFGYDWLVPE